MASYLLTYTKTRINPIDPDKKDINIIDISHALSLLTRANGHFHRFYSVGQHSINCFKEARERGCSKRIQLGCLLHDASEGYISDLTRPVKKHIHEYLKIEEKLQKAIYERFALENLTEEESNIIKDIDDAVLYYEYIEFMEVEIYGQPPLKATEYDFAFQDFGKVEKEFIDIFNKLYNE